jgi:hypothetical protein
MIERAWGEGVHPLQKTGPPRAWQRLRRVASLVPQASVAIWSPRTQRRWRIVIPASGERRPGRVAGIANRGRRSLAHVRLV